MSSFTFSCLPMFAIMAIVACMPPKGSGKAKAAPGRKRKKEEDEPGEEAEVDLQKIKVEKDAKGNYPAIPASELNRSNSRYSYLKSKGLKPLDDFTSMERAQKRAWFWEKYRFSKDSLR